MIVLMSEMKWGSFMISVSKEKNVPIHLQCLPLRRQRKIELLVVKYLILKLCFFVSLQHPARHGLCVSFQQAKGFLKNP